MRIAAAELDSPNVSVIPATKRSVKNGGQLKQQNNIRVAAYCRVSTGDESQQTSYTKQKEFYTALIRKKAGWKFAGIYADEAISGTSRSRRVEFNRMMDDALSGRLDYIVTKSISRFARNTVDTLNCVRQLQQQDPPVGIYFEKENIDTLDAKGELILTILSALAQDESRSISDNIRWTIQKKFQEGKPQLNLNRMLGYRKGEKGQWEIDPIQARTVQYIFDRFLYGCSANQIAAELNEKGWLTVNRKRWRSDGVYNVLRNEKYVGDLEMQKTITVNFLTHRSIINTGEAPKYYVKDHHESIIDRGTWDKAQAILSERGYEFLVRHIDPQARKKRGAQKSHFTNLRCAFAEERKCEGTLNRMTYSAKARHYSDERCKEYEEWAAAGRAKDSGSYLFAYPVWKCVRKSVSKCEEQNPDVPGCALPLLHECAIQQSFMEMLYMLKRDWQENGEKSLLMRLFQDAYNQACQKSGGREASGRRLEILRMQIIQLEEELRAVVEEQSGIMEAVLQTDHVADIRMRMAALRTEERRLEEEQDETLVLKRNFEFFLKCLLELPKTNAAGMRLNINGLDTDGSALRDVEGRGKSGAKEILPFGNDSVTPQLLEQAPDYLHFEKGIYMAFMRKGYLYGDRIEYVTNFNVRLVSTGNARTLSAFLGFRRANADGTVELLLETWQVNNRSVQYHPPKIIAGDPKTEWESLPFPAPPAALGRFIQEPSPYPDWQEPSENQ